MIKTKIFKYYFRFVVLQISVFYLLSCETLMLLRLCRILSILFTGRDGGIRKAIGEGPR